jgi:hypothetical protein
MRRHLQLPDMAEGSEPPDGTCITNRRTNELLVKQHTVSDAQAASPVKERAKHAQSLSCLFLPCCCVPPGQLCIKGHPKIPCCFDQFYCLSEKMNWSELLDASRSLKKSTAVLFEMLMANLQSRSQCASLIRWVSTYPTRSDNLRDEATRAVSSAYCASSTWRCVVHIQTEQHRGNESTLGHTSPHDTCGCGWLEGRLECLTVTI